MSGAGRSDADHLAHIDGDIRRIEASGAADGPLIAGTDATDATLRRLQTLTESTKQLSAELKEGHPEIPWREIAAFRNRLSHGRYSVDLGVVSDVVRDDLPALGQVVRTELKLAREAQLAMVQPAEDLGLGR